MRWLALLVLGSTVAVGCSSQNESGSGDEPLIVYSSRNDQLIRPVFERYEEATGETVRYLTDSDGALIARLEAEGAQTPADVLMTVDAGNLWRAAELDLLQPLDSELVASAIPAPYRDSKDRWTALSLRARTIVYSTERVDADQLSTYAALANEHWADRLCLRTSKKVYNQSLVASMIERLGSERTETIVEGWVANLAQPPFANDTAVIEAIVAGDCDVGIVNSYYFGRLERERPEIPVALFWANQDEGESGTHVNVSGAGITKHADHPERARALIEWLSQGEAQALFAELNMEFPANPEIPAAKRVRAWGDFRADDMPIERAGALQRQAVQLMDRAGYR
ncbi:extracellular solute-binding protein [Algiphilus aromaticivorans]|jgi:iron(III) transport system substrate-binding protein|uniref:extracellular solute-binding protein n=1 Tax=Algiphilus aromaticivorans TaxID=382454 RepID=UPI0005C25038|nr:extracellular solute-binding protein [Algiphilus aromaticivorans]